MCGVNYFHYVNESPSGILSKSSKSGNHTGKYTYKLVYQWRRPREEYSDVVGEGGVALGRKCPLTRLTKPKVVPATHTENVSTSKSVITKKLSHTAQKPLTRYQRRNQQFYVVPNLDTISVEGHDECPPQSVLVVPKPPRINHVMASTLEPLELRNHQDLAQKGF
ncbi:hypothetical protein Tco_0583233 [Tanacetum coccineum]|uniref:Uncharacterized protein n=1 Tax=Tanacetum coccineum TaxID=301880 RepID=A0ABQ4X4N2_9ASTR